MSDTAKLRIRLSNETRARLEQLSRETGRSASDLAVEALSTYVDDPGVKDRVAGVQAKRE